MSIRRSIAAKTLNLISEMGDQLETLQWLANAAQDQQFKTAFLEEYKHLEAVKKHLELTREYFVRNSSRYEHFNTRNKAR